MNAGSGHDGPMVTFTLRIPTCTVNSNLRLCFARIFAGASPIEIIMAWRSALWMYAARVTMKN